MPQIFELKKSYLSYILTYLHKHILTNLFQSIINITLLEAYIIYNDNNVNVQVLYFTLVRDYNTIRGHLLPGEWILTTMMLDSFRVI